jgi:hypothetical protein
MSALLRGTQRYQQLTVQRPHLKVMVLEPGRSGSRESCSLVGVSVLRMMMMCFFLRLLTAQSAQPEHSTLL